METKVLTREIPMPERSESVSLDPAIKENQRRTWATGDFARIAPPLVIVSENLCEHVDLRAGWKVLDVATGSGNTAIAAARRGCRVTGIDYVPALLEHGRERAAVEWMEIDFREGDAEDLPFPDASFDAVLSTFGVMFAPNQEKAAGEMARVCRPGGKIGMANWTPDGFAGGMFRVITRYLPPPPGLTPPFAWGTEERLRQLFPDSAASLVTNRRRFVFRSPSAVDWLEAFQSYFGPVRRAFETLDPADGDRLRNDLLDLIHRFNRSDDGSIVAPSDYLETVITKR